MEERFGLDIHEVGYRLISMVIPYNEWTASSVKPVTPFFMA